MSDSSAALIRVYAPLVEAAIMHCSTDDGVVRDTFKALSHLQVSSAHTIATMIGQYLVYLGHLSDDGYKQLVGLFRPKHDSWSKKALTPDQLLELMGFFIARLDGSYSRIRDLYMVSLMATLGLRISQVLLMKKDGITHAYNKIEYSVTRLKSSDEDVLKKSLYNSTPVYYSREISLTIREVHDLYMKHDLAKGTAWAFPSNRGHPLSQEYVQNLFRRASEELGFKVTPHSLRHTVGTAVAMSLGIVKAAEMLDHSDIRTTQRYVAIHQVDNSADIVQSSSVIRKEVPHVRQASNGPTIYHLDNSGSVDDGLRDH